MRTGDGGGWMTGCGDRSGPAVHRNICVLKNNFTACEFKSCACVSVQNIETSCKVHSTFHAYSVTFVLRSSCGCRSRLLQFFVFMYW